MTTELLTVLNTVISGVTLLALVTIAFHGGRWMGRVDVRLDHLENKQPEE